MEITYNQLKDNLKKAAQVGPNTANFSDVHSAAKNALKKYFGLEDATMRDIKKHQYEIFAIIEEVVDETVPKTVEDRTRDFAEIQQFGRDETPIFKINTSHNSKRRLYKAIKRGARGGVYKAYRLDGYNLDIKTEVNSVAYMITLEDILTGNRTIQELVQILADAWIEKIYYQVFEALSAAAALAPAVNQGTSASLDVPYNELDKVIRIIKAYGQPRILGFTQDIARLDNALDSRTNTIYSSQDADDIRNQGHVAVYKGVPVIELPNYLIDATNENWLFDEEMMFILPSDEKPVKVAFQGDSFTRDVEQRHGGVEYHNHRMMGVTVLFSNSIGSFKFSG